LALCEVITRGIYLIIAQMKSKAEGERLKSFKFKKLFEEAPNGAFALL